MYLKDINFGDIDAKNEILKQKRTRSTEFFESYSLPEGVDVDALLNGSKYIIRGLKGTGKTALLRFLHNKCLDRGATSEIVLFKSDVSEEDKLALANSSDFEVVKVDSTYDYTQDFKEAWKWFIYQRLAKLLKDSGVDDTYSKKFFKLTGVDGGGIFHSLGSFFSKVQKGTVKISSEAIPIAVELGVNLEEKDKGSLSAINRACSHLLDKVDYQKDVYLFFDELEVFHQTKEQFDRDRRILRDLIYAIAFINGASSETSRKIYICTTLRLEVLHSVLELGHEISRDIEDFGIELDWSTERISINHPLMRLIQRKISVSLGIEESAVWKQIFPDKIRGQAFYAYILNSTYFRPRDLVRLLRIAQGHDARAKIFTDDHFILTSAEYSKQIWVEITEEFLAVYSPEEIAALKRLLLGFSTHFFKNDLIERVEGQYRTDPVVPQMFQKYTVTKILGDLYRIGVIGNNFWKDGRNRNRWIFRGSTSLNDNERMMVHKSLWKYLSLVSANHEVGAFAKEKERNQQKIELLRARNRA